MINLPFLHRGVGDTTSEIILHHGFCHQKGLNSFSEHGSDLAIDVQIWSDLHGRCCHPATNGILCAGRWHCSQWCWRWLSAIGMEKDAGPFSTWPQRYFTTQAHLGDTLETPWRHCFVKWSLFSHWFLALPLIHRMYRVWSPIEHGTGAIREKMHDTTRIARSYCAFVHFCTCFTISNFNPFHMFRFFSGWPLRSLRGEPIEVPDSAFGWRAIAFGGSSGLKCCKRMEKDGKGTRKFWGAVFSIQTLRIFPLT